LSQDSDLSSESATAFSRNATLQVCGPSVPIQAVENEVADILLIFKKIVTHNHPSTPTPPSLTFPELPNYLRQWKEHHALKQIKDKLPTLKYGLRRLRNLLDPFPYPTAKAITIRTILSDAVNLEERRRQFRYLVDPAVEPHTIRPYSVRCAGCGRKFNTDRNSTYQSSNWNKHREICAAAIALRDVKGVNIPEDEDEGKDDGIYSQWDLEHNLSLDNM
jgi:hypothetical protein